MNKNYNQEDRKDFLIQMYQQLCSEIDRHIKIIWQIVGVLLSAFAIFALVEKNVISLDIATTILILVCSLSLAIVIESNFWYNRNLVIIANIERQFLTEKDASEIHHYFVKHRKDNAYLDMMLIQIFFIVILFFVIIFYHFSTQISPFMKIENMEFAPEKSLPYLVLIISTFLLYQFHKKRIKNYNDFKLKSPGLPMINEDEFESNSDHKT